MKFFQSKLVLGILAVAVLAALTLPLLLKNRSSAPVYFGKAIFGQDTDDESSVIHFIVRGDEIFVDKNADNIPQPEELNSDKRLPEIANREMGVTYDVHELRLGLAPESVSDRLPQQLGMTVEVRGEFPFQQLGTIVLSTDPQHTNWAQFNGPISLIYTDHDLELKKGGHETAIRVLAGTITESVQDSDPPETAAGDQTDSASAPLSLNRISYVVPQPKNAAPLLRIEYPTEDQPIVEEFRLDTMC